MTVLDVLETASLYLNLRNELDYYFNENNSTLPSSENQNKFNLLLKALNLIVQEIAIEFKPVYKEESLTFVEGVASLSSLSEAVNKIVCVKDNNSLYKFLVEEGNIICETNGEKTVKYSFVPKVLEADDDICFDEEISEKCLAFGVLMEYMYLLNAFDEVSVWEDRFYKSLKNCVRDVGRYNMPKRRWL